MNIQQKADKLIGIVTVLYNSDDVLPDFFESLARQTGVRFKLFVIDNSKSDSGSKISRELADKYKIDSEIIFNDENVGVAKGNNQGIILAQKHECGYVLLANNDTLFEQHDLLSSMVARLEKMNQPGAVTPKIYFYNQDRMIWFAGGKFRVSCASTPHFGYGKQDHGQFDHLKETEYAPTCFMMFTSSVFDRVGMMDERYFVYYDDSDFIWRMKSKNMPVGFISNQIVYHKVSHSTGGGKSVFSVFYLTRNRLMFARKNFSGLKKIVSISCFLGTHFIKICFWQASLRASFFKGLKSGLCYEI